MSSKEERAKLLPASWSLSARPCDSCKSSASLLFCRVDSAFLCLACDSKIHGAKKLDSRHERVWMCEVCEQAPASVTCKADAAALCVTCDSDIHSANPLARRHERIPVVPFYDFPTTVRSDLVPSPLLKRSDRDHEPNTNGPHACGEEEEAEAASWLLSDSNPKPAEAPNLKSADYYFSDVDPYLDLDYPSSIDTRFQHPNGTAGPDSVVPVQTKAFQHHLFVRSASENCVDLDFRHSKPTYSFTAPSLSQSVSSSSLDVGVVPDGNGSTVTDISNPYDANAKMGSVAVSASMASSQQLPGLDREARVLRYREKRKNRKFEKTIRYASRKAYAETRPRIKGRFAKRMEIDGDVDRIYSPAASLIADTGYGVVPSF